MTSSGPPVTYDARTLDPTQVDLRIPPTGTGGSGDPAQDITNSTIQVSGAPAGVITDVNVGLTLTHTFDPDLVITLISPSGTRVLLSANNGFEFPVVGQNYTNTVFDDQALTPITAGPVAVYRRVQPSGAAEPVDRRGPRRDLDARGR